MRSCLWHSHSDVEKTDLLTSRVWLVDSFVQTLVYCLLLLWGKSLQPKILDQSRQSLIRNQNNGWLCAKFDSRSLKMAISLKLFLSGKHFLKDCRRMFMKKLFVALHYSTSDTYEKGLCSQSLGFPSLNLGELWMKRPMCDCGCFCSVCMPSRSPLWIQARMVSVHT